MALDMENMSLQVPSAFIILCIALSLESRESQTLLKHGNFIFCLSLDVACRTLDLGNKVIGLLLLMFFVFFFFLIFLGLHLQHMEVPRLGVELELQLPAYSTATATPDLNHIYDLQCSSQQCQMLNPLIEARDQTCIFMDTSWIHFC